MTRPHEISSILRRRAAWLGVLAIGGMGLPVAWHITLMRWLQNGWPAGMTWSAVALAQLAVFALLCRWLAATAPRGHRRQMFAFAAAAWCAAQVICWQWRASPLIEQPFVMLAYVSTSFWLGWCGAMFFTRLPWPGRIKVLVVLTLPLAAWIGLVKARGLDGHARPLLAWRFAAEARAAGNTLDQPATHDATSQQATYSGFRGSDGLGIVEGVRLARDWSVQPPRLRWRRSIGGGWGGFAIVGERAYTQEQRGDLETVVCYELATGRERWVHTDRAAFRSAMGGEGPRATPAVVEDAVYTLGATGILNCLDAHTGHRRWSIDVLADNGASNLFHGLSGSPLIVGDAVVISAGGPRGGSLAAYHRRTGNRRFSGGDDPAGYGSPLLCKLGGQPQILVFNRPGLAAHDPQTGELLWTFPWSNDQETNCSQPVPLGGDHVLVSTGYGKGSALIAVRPTDETWSAEAVWTSRGLKCKFSSPVVRGGFAYGLDDGVLACLDLADGRRRWRAGRYGHGQLLLVGDLLLIQAESGEVVLAAATPDEHRELGRFAAIEGKTWNYPALAGSLLLVRNDHEAACFELPVEQDHAVGNGLRAVPPRGGATSPRPTRNGTESVPYRRRMANHPQCI